MLHEFGMRSFTYSFGLLLLVFPKPLSGPLEALMSLATSTIFYWTLFMPLYLFLVYDIHLLPCFANVVLAVDGVFLKWLLVMMVTAQARTVSGHKY